jgi:hypothetical protein
MSHQLERPRPVRELRPGVPEAMAAVIDRMMAKDPAERYETPADIVTALEPWTQTPIPPPPPEEMPELVTPARRAGGAATAPGLPAFLYGPSPAPAPGSAPEADKATPAGSQRPTAPLPDALGKSLTPAASRAAGRPGSRRRNPALIAAAVLLVGAAAALVVYGLIPKGQPVASTTVPTTVPQATEPRGQPPVVVSDSPKMKLLVPAYFYPAGDELAQWDRLLESPAAASTVLIVNTDSGPGQAANPDYAKVLERAQRQGVTVIGYVSTKYAKRPIAEVKEDVDRWLRFYPERIRGIFFDEQNSSADQVHYYVALYEYVRKQRGLSLVVTNPGTTCAEEYLSRHAADVVCLVEAPKDFRTYELPAWTSRYTADHFAAMTIKVGAEQMRETVQKMRAKGIGYAFVTDADEPNPWGRLPVYWDEEVKTVQEANPH